MSQTAAGGSGTEADGGFALIEILVSVSILGIAFVAILGGMATAANTSSLHRQQAEVDAVLTSAVERVKSPEVVLVACALPAESTYVAAARSAATAEGWDPATVQITEVLRWNGTTYGPTESCDNPMLALQQITIEVTHPDGRATNALTFVKGVG